MTNVLRDESSILPTINSLLIDYLKDDFANVSSLMEKGLVDGLWVDSIKDGLFNSVNSAAQNNLIDP